CSTKWTSMGFRETMEIPKNRDRNPELSKNWKSLSQLETVTRPAASQSRRLNSFVIRQRGFGFRRALVLPERGHLCFDNNAWQRLGARVQYTRRTTTTVCLSVLKR